MPRKRCGRITVTVLGSSSEPVLDQDTKNSTRLGDATAVYVGEARQCVAQGQESTQGALPEGKVVLQSVVNRTIGSGFVTSAVQIGVKLGLVKMLSFLLCSCR